MPLRSEVHLAPRSLKAEPGNERAGTSAVCLAPEDASRAAGESLVVLRAPKAGELLLYLLLSRKDREEIAGDLQEELPEVHEKFGIVWATVWYYCQVLRTIAPHLTSVSTRFRVVP